MPLIAIGTSDPASAIHAVRSALDANTTTAPLLRWDIVHGLVGLNKPGREEVTRVLGDSASPLASAGPAEALELAEKLDDDAALFFANAHRFFQTRSLCRPSGTCVTRSRRMVAPSSCSLLRAPHFHRN